MEKFKKRRRMKRRKVMVEMKKNKQGEGKRNGMNLGSRNIEGSENDTVLGEEVRKRVQRLINSKCV
jgi:hypothetical protein